MDFRIHWLSLTIHSDLDYGLELWDDLFEPYLGSMTHSGHGAKGFKAMLTSLAGAVLYGFPAGIPAEDINDQYIHIMMPGSACDALPNEVFQSLLKVLMAEVKFKVTRLDLAWDGVPFTPRDVEQAITQENIRSLAKRRTMSFTQSAFESKDNGDLGTSSLKLGSRYSSRMIRVYDKRGPVRLEMQLRDKRAHEVTLSVLEVPVSDWSALAVSHLRDYIDFVDPETDVLLPWWEEFILDNARAMLTVSDARKIELDRMMNWLETQVSTTLSVVHDVYGERVVSEIIDTGREKRGKRYDSLLQGVTRNE